MKGVAGEKGTERRGSWRVKGFGGNKVGGGGRRKICNYQ